jgi:hypothetical protein
VSNPVNSIGAVTVGTASDTATIVDEDSVDPTDPVPGDELGDAPVVNIVATDAVAVEGGLLGANELSFTVSQSNESNVDTNITVTLDLDEVESADIASVTYLDAAGVAVVTSVAALVAGLDLTIDANSSYAPVFTFTAVDDSIFESSESLTLGVALNGASDATIGTGSASAVIDDEDDAAPGDKLGEASVVSVVATDDNAVEGTTNNTAVFTVSQSTVAAADTTVDIALTLGDVETADITSIVYTDASGALQTVTGAVDIAAFVAGGDSVIIAAGDTAAPVITITFADDAVFEGSET